MNYKVVVDAGHGGLDPGAVGNEIIEKDLNLKISRYMHERLNELGIENSMTRTFDETLSPSERTKRIQNFYGNGSDVIVVSNHINAGGGDGAEIIYALRNSEELSSIIAGELLKTPQNFRSFYQKRLPSNLSKDFYSIMRETPNNETIIVEYGFLDSGGDDIFLLKNNWQELTEAVVKGLLEYMGRIYIAPVENTTSDNHYTVKVGDTLWTIAKQYNLNIDELKNLNNLTNNMLTVGQRLKISNIPANEDTYTIQAGDDLYSIAKRYNLTINELRLLNNLTSDLLSVGQQLAVKPKSNIDNYINYMIQAGDSLYRIAQANNTTVNAITQLNNLTLSELNIGQVIKIPKVVKDNVHMVRPNDSLYEIARQYNTTVDKLREANNLISDILIVGQKILIV